jgi:hypothetical protein
MNNNNETRIILGSEKYKTAIDTDLSIKVPLESNQKEIDEFDRNTRVSLAQVFDDERQKSSTFRLSAEIDLIYYNAYSGTTGIVGSNYFPFTNNLYYVNSVNSFGTSSWSGYPLYNEFEFIRSDNNVSGYTTNSGYTPAHVYFTNKSASTYNWGYYVTYPYENDYLKTLQYYDEFNNTHTWFASNGIPFYIVNPYTDNGQDLISFVCPVEHNLSEGEYVQILIPGWSGFNGQTVFQVYSLGQTGYNSDKFIFNIYDYGFSPSDFPNQANGTFKRIIDITNSAETMSKYYVRKHKVLTNIDEAILTKAGFELNAFENQKKYEYATQTPNNVARIMQREGSQSYLLTFSKDINIAPYLDNLKRPLTELFITIVNKGYFGWFNKPILNLPNYPALREGYYFNLTNSVSPYWASTNYSVINSNLPTDSYVRGAYTFYYNRDLQVNDVLNGDFCEYNQYEQVERVISDYYQKFIYNNNLFKESSIISNPAKAINQDGFYYKPHNKIILRTFSNYIEEGEIKNTVDVPNYAYYSSFNGKLIWRDIYTYGYIDTSGVGVDYPFLNGTHYPSTKIIFRVIPEGNIAEDINAISDPIIDGCE